MFCKIVYRTPVLVKLVYFLKFFTLFHTLDNNLFIVILYKYNLWTYIIYTILDNFVHKNWVTLLMMFAVLYYLFEKWVKIASYKYPYVQKK